MLQHSVVAVAPALAYQVVAAGVTLVSDVTVFVDDVFAVAAAEAAAGAAIAAVASQPVNNHYYRLVLWVN
jgi:dihydropteroate synthase